MNGRKKWTPTTPTDSILQAREKKKWQIALRRYLLERQPSVQYAPYFGLDIELFREWIALQFRENLDWQNFGTDWQLEHVLPSQYFDLSKDEERKLCWNFINIKVEPTGEISNPGSDGFHALPYFESLSRAGNFIAKAIMEKITTMMSSTAAPDDQLHFLKKNQEEISSLAGFTAAEFLRVNKGEPTSALVKEKEILKKFGS